MVNPYAFTGPVRDPAMFFGRRTLRHDILDGLRRGESFAITGTVRIGKSSLLFRLRHALREQLKAPAGAALVPVLVRNRDFSGPSLSIVCQRIVDELGAALSAPESAEDWQRGLRLFSGNLEDGETIRAFTEAIATIMRARGADSRLVLMIDDVDRLSQHAWSRVLFDELRQLVQKASDGVRISLLVTGDFVPWSSPEALRSPFPDIAITLKTLGLLSADETGELVTRPTGIDGESAIVSSIVFETGGHPFLAKYLMNKLVDAIDGDLTRATPEALRGIVDLYFSERADFRRWALRFTDGDRRAYDLIASGQGATRDDLLRGLGNPQQASRAIQVLVQTGVVSEEQPGSDRYVVGGEMFRRWFYDTRQLSTSTNTEAVVVRSPRQPPL
ncbi:MAG TPA: ATP-binding protein, partial [Vicinamibacterales bacterium]|nr:ATP-binding protein [Vicinamibacterales bacterium]